MTLYGVFVLTYFLCIHAILKNLAGLNPDFNAAISLFNKILSDEITVWLKSNCWSET